VPRQKNSPGKGAGPEPCITGPAKCNNPPVKVVAWGVDALYTTYDGDLKPELVEVLDLLKQEAQQDDAPALFPSLILFGEPVMVHRSGGVKGYRYHVSNSKVDAFLVGGGKNQPALWVQPRAEYLREVGPRRLVEKQRECVRALFEGIPEERANRLDLHVDLAGLSWDAFDLRAMGDRFEVVNATTRGKDVQIHSSRGKMTGFTVGKRSGSTYLRVYDKTQELADKHHLSALAEGEVTHYLPQIWREHGWMGQVGYNREGKPLWERVLRVEFELGREVLKQFKRAKTGDPFVDSWEQALPLLDSIWRYCLLRWFVMREPGEATQKTRWPVAEWWAKLADLPMLDGPQAIGARICQKSSNKRKLAQLAAGLTASLGALDGLSQGEAIHRLVALVQAEYVGKPYQERKDKKARSWRTRLPLEWIAEQEGWAKRKQRGIAS